jgi:hypothetical protein
VIKKKRTFIVVGCIVLLFFLFFFVYISDHINAGEPVLKPVTGSLVMQVFPKDTNQQSALSVIKTNFPRALELKKKSPDPTSTKPSPTDPPPPTKIPTKNNGKVPATATSLFHPLENTTTPPTCTLTVIQETNESGITDATETTREIGVTEVTKVTVSVTQKVSQTEQPNVTPTQPSGKQNDKPKGIWVGLLFIVVISIYIFRKNSRDEKTS